MPTRQTPHAGNLGAGVFVAAPNTLIGGSSSTDRDVISGNSGPGVWVAGASGTRLNECFIGTTADGTGPNGNRQEGILVEASTHVRIGMGDRTVVSGNAAGIRIAGGSDVSVYNAYIGTSATGKDAVPNEGDGIIVSAGKAEISGCTISGNRRAGVRVSGTGTASIHTNVVGIDTNGLHKVPNGGNGIEVLDASAEIGRYARDGNVISGNLGHGVLVAGPRASASLIANFIGTDARRLSPARQRGQRGVFSRFQRAGRQRG